MQAERHFSENWIQHLEDLKNLVRIPSVSFPGFPAENVKKSAQAVADLLRSRGLEGVEILRIGDAHPYVYGEWLKKPGAPTVLLYAHHDVQPVGRESVWQTPPFEPTLRPGPGGDRLYGRGTADDKAGIVIHTAAIASFLQTVGELPVNVKLVIEGEEEIGSSHLAEFLKIYRKKLDADVLVLTDTSNFDCGVPGLTVSLRGLVALEVEVRALTKTVHSGMWGGPVPDPVQALSRLIAGLSDAEGQLALPEIRALVPKLSADVVARLSRLPFDEKSFRDQSGMVDSARLLPGGPSPWAQLWLLPSLTVTAIQASSRAQAGNIINDTAWAKVTVRVPPGMSSRAVCDLLRAYFHKNVAWGLELSLQEDACADGWGVSPEDPRFKPAFDAAMRAMKAGYGREPVFIGCGGSIPFVQPFADALGGAPALLIGVEDPYTNAHGENESLLISDFKSAILSEIHLFEELARVGGGR